MSIIWSVSNEIEGGRMLQCQRSNNFWSPEIITKKRVTFIFNSKDLLQIITKGTVPLYLVVVVTTKHQKTTRTTTHYVRTYVRTERKKKN